MINIAWSEFLFIFFLALILIGPRELPSLLRNIGRWVGRARSMTHDLYREIEAASEEKSVPAPSPDERL